MPTANIFYTAFYFRQDLVLRDFKLFCPHRTMQGREIQKINLINLYRLSNKREFPFSDKLHCYFAEVFAI
jgi:hypothetical protein